MKISFLSNFFNHHQEPISAAFDRNEEVDYTFIATEDLPEDRKKLGYFDIAPRYVYKAYEDQEVASKVLAASDVVITGSAPEKMVRKCIKAKKLVFRYSERPLKDSREFYKFPIRLVRWNWRNPRNKPIYMLCASAYTAGDYAKLGLFKGRTYKWGYFPKTNRYDIESLLSQKKKNLILWCGRFLPLKHPEVVIEVARRLKNDNYDFQIQFVGMGIMENDLKALVEKSGLQGQISFLGAMDPDQVRERMEKAGIFLFTSDRNEGWGAVLNESMNSGCAVVASHSIGSVPFLIKKGENGLVYESGNADMLYEKVSFLLDHPEEQVRLGKNAYCTITEEWNAEEAAVRLVHLATHILSGNKKPNLYESGPCSAAEIITEKYRE